MEAKQGLEEYNSNRLDGEVLHGYRTPVEAELDWAIPAAGSPAAAASDTGSASDYGSRRNLLATFELEGGKGDHTAC